MLGERDEEAVRTSETKDGGVSESRLCSGRKGLGNGGYCCSCSVLLNVGYGFGFRRRVLA